MRTTLRKKSVVKRSLAAGVVLLSASAWVPSVATAAEVSVDNVEFTWSLNNETNWASFQPGAYNFLSAGIVPKTSAGDTVTADEWQQSSGNVAIEKEQTDGSFAAATWDGLFTNIAGQQISAPFMGSNGPSGNRVKLSNGTGTLDPEGDNASISWDGSFSVIYYQGLTQWYASDLELTIEGSSGWLTATLGGYGTSMSDSGQFVPLEEVQDVPIAQLSNVDVTATGLNVTPDYPILDIAGSDGSITRARSWPAQFVDFQGQTGQGSYWYASGGSADPRKVPTEIGVAVPAPQEAPYFTPKVQNVSNEGFEVRYEGFNFPNGFLDVFLVNKDQDLSTRPSGSQLISNSAIAYPENGYIQDEFSLKATAAKLANYEPSDTYLLVAWGQSYLNSGVGFVGSTEVVLTDEQFATVFPAAPELVSEPENVSVEESQSATFTATASGRPTPTIKWESSTDGSDWAVIDGAVETTLTLDTVSLGDNGTQYRAVFSNANGEVTSTPASLSVTEREFVAPSEPTNVTASSIGNSVSVTWTASTEDSNAPVTNYVITLKDSEGIVQTIEVDSAETSANFDDVADGEYEVEVFAKSAAGNSATATTTVSVNTEVPGGSSLGSALESILKSIATFFSAIFGPLFALFGSS